MKNVMLLAAKTMVMVALSAMNPFAALADGPVPFSSASGPPAPGPARPDVCWDQTYNLNGSKLSSEIIGAFGLESEVATDIIFEDPPFPGCVLVCVHGGEYTWAPGDPVIEQFNFLIYEDAGGVPGDPIVSFMNVESDSSEVVGYDADGTVVVQRCFWVCDEGLLANVPYWISVQAADHPFPPNWGRQEALEILGFEGMFRSAFFGYPDWTPAGDMVGYPWDASVIVDCGAPTAVQKATWGRIKSLFD